MEPANLTPPSSENRLDTLLRETPALADDGFSNGVLAALPMGRQVPQRRRLILCLSGLAAGIAVALPNLDQWPNLAALSTQLTRTLTDLGANPSVCMGFSLAITALFLTLRSGKSRESWL